MTKPFKTPFGERFFRGRIIPSEALHFQAAVDNLGASASSTASYAAGRQQVPDNRPGSIQDLQGVFDMHAFTENAYEGPVMYVLTWVLHGNSRQVNAQSKVGRLQPTCFDWRSDIVFPWREFLTRGSPVHFHVVRPFPPRSPWQSHAAHIILSQEVSSEQREVLVTSVQPSTDGVDVHHAACLVGSVLVQDLADIVTAGSVVHRAHSGEIIFSTGSTTAGGSRSEC